MIEIGCGGKSVKSATSLLIEVYILFRHAARDPKCILINKSKLRIFRIMNSNYCSGYSHVYSEGQREGHRS